MNKIDYSVVAAKDGLYRHFFEHNGNMTTRNTFLRYMKQFNLWIGIGFCTFLEAQNPIPQIFIKMEWKDSLDTPIHLGHYAYDNAFNIDIETVSKNLSITDTSSFSTFFQPYLQNLNPSRPEVLIYVHGYSADSKYYQKFTNTRLQEHVYSNKASPYGLIVNLVWDKSNLYTTELRRSKQKGILFAQYLSPLLEAYQEKFPKQLPSIICHSMGNRILEGILEHLQELKFGLHFKTIIMACPDLEYDALHRSKAFKNLDQLSQEVVLYVHNNDRVLTVATQSNKIERLGLKGPEKWDSLPANLTVVDASLLTDNKDLGSKFSNHRYFYTSATGREDLMRSLGILHTEKYGKREVLDRSFRYVIEPKDQ